MIKQPFGVNKMKHFIGSKNNRSESDDGDYIAAVTTAVNNYEAFTKFKQDPRYTTILEHANAQQGNACLEIIMTESPELMYQMDDFKDNDIEGGTTTVQYEFVGAISPTTLRYIKVASDIKKIFGNFSFEKIAEIGVGYGGQLLINDKIFKFKEYHLFDLPPVLNLAEKYLECHNLNNSYKTTTLNQHSGDIYYDLSISNYAFSELPSKLQMKYIEKIFSKSLRGYLTMNSGLSNSAFQNDKLSLQELKKCLPKFEVIEERPLTHPGNYIIIWGL